MAPAKPKPSETSNMFAANAGKSGSKPTHVPEEYNLGALHKTTTPATSKSENFDGKQSHDIRVPTRPAKDNKAAKVVNDLPEREPELKIKAEPYSVPFEWTERSYHQGEGVELDPVAEKITALTERLGTVEDRTADNDAASSKPSSD